MVEVLERQEAQHHRDAGRQRDVIHRAPRTVVAPDDGDHGGERHGYAGELGKAVPADQQAVAAGGAEHERRADRAGIVPVLPVADAVHVERAGIHPVETAHAGRTQRPDEHDQRAADEEEGVVGLGIDEGERDDMRNHAHEEGLAVPVKRADERQVDIDRQRVVTLILHGLGTPFGI